MEASDNIQNIYMNYYGDEQLARWRQLSTKDKAKNIIALWSSVGKKEPATVVDIGCAIRPGLPGIWRYLLKASLLRICPGLACRLGTYNAGFIATNK